MISTTRMETIVRTKRDDSKTESKERKLDVTSDNFLDPSLFPGTIVLTGTYISHLTSVEE